MSDKKSPKESSELFHNIMKASMSPKATGAKVVKLKTDPTEYELLLKDERTLLEDIKQAQHYINSMNEDLAEVRKKLAKEKPNN